MTTPNLGSRVIHARLSATEHNALVAAATRLRESRARLLRRAVRELIGHPAPLLDHELAGLVDAVFQLKAVARNLAQLLQAVHAGKVIADVKLLESVHASVIALDARIAELVNASRLRETRS